MPNGCPIPTVPIPPQNRNGHLPDLACLQHPAVQKRRPLRPSHSRTRRAGAPALDRARRVDPGAGGRTPGGRWRAAGPKTCCRWACTLPGPIRAGAGRARQGPQDMESCRIHGRPVCAQPPPELCQTGQNLARGDDAARHRTDAVCLLLAVPELGLPQKRPR